MSASRLNHDCLCNSRSIHSLLGVGMVGDLMKTKRKKKENDVHHCCGKYIKTKADRARHNGLLHSVPILKSMIYDKIIAQSYQP